MKEKRFKEFRAMSLSYKLLVIIGIIDIIGFTLECMYSIIYNLYMHT